MDKLILSFNDFKKEKRIVVQNEKLDFECDKDDLVKCTNLSFSFEANRYDDVIDVVGKISGIMTFECSRCLDIFEQNVNIGFECSWTKEEFEFDVLKEIKEAVLLNIPAKPLCKQDCKGLCQYCGNNKNIKDCFCEQNRIDEFVAEKWSKIKKLKI